MNDKSSENGNGLRSVDELTPEEIRELKDKFGIEIKDSVGLKDALDKLRATRERIEEIEKKALKKLKGSEDPNEGG